MPGPDRFKVFEVLGVSGLGCRACKLLRLASPPAQLQKGLGLRL